MKNTNSILIAALAGITLSLLAGSTQAQVKGGEKLVQQNGTSITAPAAPDGYKPMSCAKCLDVSTTVSDSTAKGASALAAHGAPTKSVASHTCGSCATTISTIGVGKQAKDVTTHKCDMAATGSMSCCGVTK